VFVCGLPMCVRAVGCPRVPPLPPLPYPAVTRGVVSVLRPTNPTHGLGFRVQGSGAHPNTANTGVRRLYGVGLRVSGGAEFGGPLDSSLTCVAFLGRVYLAGVALCVYVCGTVCLVVRASPLCLSVSLCLVLFSRRRVVRG